VIQVHKDYVSGLFRKQLARFLRLARSRRRRAEVLRPLTHESVVALLPTEGRWPRSGQLLKDLYPAEARSGQLLKTFSRRISRASLGFFFFWVFYKAKFKPLWEVFEAMGWGLSQLNCHMENLMNFSNN